MYQTGAVFALNGYLRITLQQYGALQPLNFNAGNVRLFCFKSQLSCSPSFDYRIPTLSHLTPRSGLLTAIPLLEVATTSSNSLSTALNLACHKPLMPPSTDVPSPRPSHSFPVSHTLSLVPVFCMCLD